MSIYEYNEEEHMRMEREESYEDGYKAGRALMLELIAKISADGLTKEIPRLTKDSDFYQEMVKKYMK